MLLTDIIERGMYVLTVRQGIPPLKAEGSQPRSDCKHSGGILPHQIAMIGRELPPRGDLCPIRSIHHHPGVAEVYKALYHQKAVSSGQRDGLAV